MSTTAIDTTPAAPTTEARAEWLSQRRVGIGGTDAAAILGTSKYRTAYDVWADKTGTAPDNPGNDNTFFGNVFESAVAQAYEWRTGNGPVTFAPTNIRLEGTPLIANPDRFVGDDGILECKTTVSAVFRTWRGAPPMDYVTQVIHYLAVTGRQWADIAVMVLDARQLHTFRVVRDEATIKAHVAVLTDWWEQHIVGGAVPAMTAADLAEVEAVEGASVSADAAVAQAVKDYDELRELIDALTAQKEAAEELIKSAIGDAEVLTIDGTPAFTWKNVTSKRFDSTAFKKAQPETYTQFTKESTTRTFRRVGYRKAQQ